MAWLKQIMLKLGIAWRPSKNERREAEIKRIMRHGLSDIYDARLKLMILRDDLRKLRAESEKLLESDTTATIKENPDKDNNDGPV